MAETVRDRLIDALRQVDSPDDGAGVYADLADAALLVIADAVETAPFGVGARSAAARWLRGEAL